MKRLSVIYLGLAFFGIVLFPFQSINGQTQLPFVDYSVQSLVNRSKSNNHEDDKSPADRPLDVDTLTIRWISPVGDGEVFNVGDQIVNLEVEVQGSESGVMVRYYYWDAVREKYVTIGSVIQAPYSVSFDTSVLNPGYTPIFVRAYCDVGNSSRGPNIWLYKVLDVFLPLVNK